MMTSGNTCPVLLAAAQQLQYCTALRCAAVTTRAQRGNEWVDSIHAGTTPCQMQNHLQPAIGRIDRHVKVLDPTLTDSDPCKRTRLSGIQHREPAAGVELRLSAPRRNPRW
ncbi:hypothetical protein KC362_g64 [Hortaea werneckii]|nr:hypothetical protein KC362_g64 [Hortaea werneckii]